jgi:isopropylmalate/homocitrate/citramalate synthase
MKLIDITLREGAVIRGRALSFKEKLEIVRQLDKLCVDTIELPEIENAKADCLFVRTVAAFVKNSVISVAV